MERPEQAVLTPATPSWTPVGDAQRGQSASQVIQALAGFGGRQVAIDAAVEFRSGARESGGQTVVIVIAGERGPPGPPGPAAPQAGPQVDALGGSAFGKPVLRQPAASLLDPAHARAVTDTRAWRHLWVRANQFLPAPSRVGPGVLCYNEGLLTRWMYCDGTAWQALVCTPFRIVFAFPDQALSSGIFIPRPAFPLFNHFGAANFATTLQCTATAGTAGTGVNTIKIQSSTGNPFTGGGSWTDRVQLDLGTSLLYQTTNIASWWNPTTTYVRANCTAVGATAPKDVMVYIDGFVYGRVPGY